MTTPTVPPLGGLADPYGEGAQVLIEQPDAGGKPPESDYVPPLEESVAIAGLWVSVRQCTKCGARFPVAVGVYSARLAQEARVDDRQICDRCTYGTSWPVPPADLIAVMQQLRWRYDEYRWSITRGESDEQTKARFNRAVNLCFSLAPKLLEELERIYGDQVVAGVQAVVNG